MLNCFYWYAAIWTFILILYHFDISNFNMTLNPLLFIFLVITIIISLFLGLVLKKNFKFIYKEGVPKNLNKKVYAIVVGYIIEFIYAGYIPLISIAITKTNIYSEFPGIPIFHVILNGLTSFYAIKIAYYAICNKKERKKLVKMYIILMLMFLLMYYRSMLVINIFMVLLLFIAYLQSEKKIKIKHYIIMLFSILIMCYIYGGIGNIRDGYKWNDNSYIEKLGMYKTYPSIIPKQYMWTYSYLTTPLANLNYNVLNNQINYDTLGFVKNIMPNFLSKRLNINNNANETLLIRTYFNATTGWTAIYLNSGIEGMYIMYFIITFIIIFVLYNCQQKKNNQKYENNTIILAILCVIVIFMFFYNTLSYVGTSLMFYIALISLIAQKK